MQFKITIITGVLFLLIGSLSIANPINEKETPPQKTEKAKQKKSNFIQKIIPKKIKKKIERNKEGTLPLSKVSLALGILAFPLVFAYGIGFVVGLAALITGIIALSKNGNRKSRAFSIAGIVLGAIILALFAALLPIILYSISEANFFNE